MMRRGIMGALGALASGGALARATVTASPRGAASQLVDHAVPPPYGGEACASGLDPKWALKQKAYDLAMKPVQRRQRRAQIAASLTNGWPPHIAVMESNALWFRAQRAAVWIEAQEHAREGLLTQISERFFGPSRGDF